MKRNFNTAMTAENKDEWLTPPPLIAALGFFDLDPCTPIKRPWNTALMHYNVLNDGLVQPWFGRVFCNPPYGNETFKWMEKCATHGNAIALIFARTETIGFHSEIWEKADAVFFFKGRQCFWHQPFKSITDEDPEKLQEKLDKAAKKHFRLRYDQLNEQQLEQWLEGDTANAPSCLVAYGERNVEAIARSGLPGVLVRTID